jgi:hypothetical protein
MDEIAWSRLARKRERLRTHGTDNPFCAACGEHHYAVRFELHHIAGRRHDDRVIRLCFSCHDKASDMQKDYPPIPRGTDPCRAKLIAMARGRIIMNRLMLGIDEEIEAWLSGTIALPPLPAKSNENGDEDQ